MRMMQKNHDGFKRGSGAFKCDICGKMTRETPETSGTHLCGKCYKECIEENRRADGK
jgi:hypothetical protein